MEWLQTWKANLQGDSVEMSTPTALGCGGHTDHPGFYSEYSGVEHSDRGRQAEGVGKGSTDRLWSG